MSEKIMRASKVGFPCDRNLWYSVSVGCEEEKILEKTQRIFDVGNALEPLVVKWLKDDGWIVDYNPGSQNAEDEFFIPVQNGKLAGHPDAFIEKSLTTPVILVDIKTMNDYAFRLWKRSGTLKKYPQYVDQLHVYAGGYNRVFRNKIENLGIVGVNKNTSEMHYDFFNYDENRTQEIIERTERIFALDNPPEPGERMQNWCCSYCGYSWLCEIFQKEHDTHVGDSIATTNNKNIIDAIELLKEARELSNTGKELEDEAKQVLDIKVRQQGIKEIQTGSLILSLTESEGKTTFDKKSFAIKYPDLLKEFTHIGEKSVRYNIKEVVLS